MGNVNFSIVSVPLPFEGKDGIRQRSAIQSWMRLEGGSEVVLLGDDAGVREYADHCRLRHVPDLARNEVGDLSCRDIIAKAQASATHENILYVDCDVLLMPNLLQVLRHIVDKYPLYKVVSGRWEIPTPENDLVFAPGWQERVQGQICCHYERGTDFHAFPKGLYDDIPDFSIGAGAWDGWMIWYAAQQGAIVLRIDAFKAALHMKHGRPWWKREGKSRNQRLAGNSKRWVNDERNVRLRPEDILGFLGERRCSS